MFLGLPVYQPPGFTRRFVVLWSSRGPSDSDERAVDHPDSQRPPELFPGTDGPGPASGPWIQPCPASDAARKKRVVCSRRADRAAGTQGPRIPTPPGSGAVWTGRPADGRGVPGVTMPPGRFVSSGEQIKTNTDTLLSVLTERAEPGDDAGSEGKGRGERFIHWSKLLIQIHRSQGLIQRPKAGDLISACIWTTQATFRGQTIQQTGPNLVGRGVCSGWVGAGIP